VRDQAAMLAPETSPIPDADTEDDLADGSEGDAEA
jgi:hypothetical protein